MTTLAERDVSQDLPCVECGQPLWRIHPGAKFALQWGHTTKEDSVDCPGRRKRGWPVPSAEGIMAQLDAARAELAKCRRDHAEQLEPWLGKAHGGQ